MAAYAGENIVEFRINGNREQVLLRDLTTALILQCEPMRAFKWHRGQTHTPGWYWSVTTREHFQYESWHELEWLRIADMDRNVTHIVSQPLKLTGVDRDGQKAHHTPDFAWLGRDGSLGIVDIKPVNRLDEEKVARQFEWTSRALEGEGIDYEVWSGLSTVAESNSSFLACYRNPALFDPAILENARTTLATLKSHSAYTLDAVEAHLVASAIPDARSVLFHLVWSGDLRLDLESPISHQSPLEVA